MKAKTSFLKEFKLSKLHLIVIILGFLGIITFIYLKQRQSPFPKGEPGQSQGWGQRPGGAQDFGGPTGTQAYKRWQGTIPKPPQGEVIIYKGFWSPPLISLRAESPFSNVDKVKEIGANIISFGPQFLVDKNGNIGYPWDFPTMEDLDSRMGELASIYYPKGIRFSLVLSTNYVEQITKEAGGPPQPFPRDLLAKKGFLDKYNKVVEEMAKIAQKYQVEMFSPLNEPDGNLGVEIAYQWNEEMLPRIKKYYKGKLYYKGDLHNGEGEKLSFKGYDVLGFMPSAPINDSGVEFRRLVAKNIANAIKWAKRDEVPKIMVAEFGAWAGMNLTDQAALSRYKILFEEGKGKVNGFSVIDPPSDQPNFLKGQILEELKLWYTTKL